MIHSGLFDGANLFFWIVCVAIGAIVALSGVDNLYGSKKEQRRESLIRENPFSKVPMAHLAVHFGIPIRPKAHTFSVFLCLFRCFSLGRAPHPHKAKLGSGCCCKSVLPLWANTLRAFRAHPSRGGDVEMMDLTINSLY